MKAAAAHLRDNAQLSETTSRSAYLPPDCRTVFRQIARGCIKTILSHKTRAPAGDAEAVHDMRVELTRLHAIWIFFAPLIHDDDWERLDRDIRWLNSVLGRARNRDVAIEHASRKSFRDWAKRSRRALLRAQDAAHHRLARKLRSARYRRLSSGLLAWRSQLPVSYDNQSHAYCRIDAYCDERLGEWRGDISKMGRNLSALNRKQLHQLRIQSKHYRYVVEALLGHDVPVSREDFAFCEIASDMHRTLGDLRDLKQFRRAVGRRPPHYGKRKHELIRRVAKLLRRRSRAQ